MQQATKKQVYNYTEASCEETVESTSVAIPNSDHHKNASQAVFSRGHNNKEGHHLFNVDDYNAVSPCYWGAFAWLIYKLINLCLKITLNKLIYVYILSFFLRDFN